MHISLMILFYPVNYTTLYRLGLSTTPDYLFQTSILCNILKRSSNSDNCLIPVQLFRDSLVLTGMSLVVAITLRRLASTTVTAPGWVSGIVNYTLKCQPGQILLLTKTSLEVNIYISYPRKFKSRGNSVDIVTGYGLENRMIEVRFLAGAGNFSLRHHVQTGSRAHPASYPMGTGFFAWSKAAWA